MGKCYYKKNGKNNVKKYLRIIGGLIFLAGILMITYVFLPIISWQIYFQPVFASQNIILSVPQANIVDLAKNSTDFTDYNKAENWFKNYYFDFNKKDKTYISSYTISIPEIKIDQAIVSTVDTDLTKHLVNYQGTSVPGKNGNTVIFGHSTLPQLFNPKDYKTIFANIYKLKNGDNIYSTINGITYTYKIFKTIVVNSTDNTVLIQNYDDSYLTLVTCTPPGTAWKRLVVEARLNKI
jgi:sortase A